MDHPSLKRNWLKDYDSVTVNHTFDSTAIHSTLDILNLLHTVLTDRFVVTSSFSSTSTFYCVLTTIYIHSQRYDDIRFFIPRGSTLSLTSSSLRLFCSGRHGTLTAHLICHKYLEVIVLLVHSVPTGDFQERDVIEFRLWIKVQSVRVRRRS